MRSSHPLDGVAVDVYSASGTEVGGTTTGSNGTYSVIGLATGSYDVCFGVSTYEEPTGGSSTTGYLDQCYKNVNWNGTSTPSGATAVSVTAGSITSGVNAALATAGAISGTVDDASSHPLDGVAVEVYSTSGSSVGGATTTAANGTYSVIGLATGSYDVCFAVSTYEEPTGGSSTTGYLDQCYKNVNWNGTSTPSGATAVPVTAGSTTSGVNAALATVGAISGTVDDASSHPLDGVEVEVYSTSGSPIGYASTGSNGTYSVIGLATGTYDVCFSTSEYDLPTGGTSTTGYGNQCYNGVTWDGATSDISGATAVHVTAGSTTSDINVALPNGGVVSGTVDDSSSHPLGDVEVEVVSSTGQLVGEGVTSANGSYSIEGLSAGTYDVCFDANYFDPFGGGVTGGSPPPATATSATTTSHGTDRHPTSAERRQCT